MGKVKNVFKVGDKVRVKSSEELEECWDDERMSFVLSMYSFAGKKGIIESDNDGIYRCSFDRGWYNWLPEWLEPVEETSMCYFKGAPGRGEEIKRELLNMGGRIREGMPEYTYEDTNFYYFIDPTDNYICGVEINSLTGRVVQSSWSEIILPEEKVQQKAEEKKLFVLVHDNRCMRRLVNSPEEARHFAEWIQKDKPGTEVLVYEVKLHERINENPF